MATILRKFAQTLDFVAQSRAPLDTNGGKAANGAYEKKFNDFHELIVKPAFKIEDLPAYIDALENMGGVGIDDRQLLLEKMLVAMSRLSDYPAVSMKIQKYVITLLYKDLPHPPATYLTLPPSLTSAPQVHVVCCCQASASTANGSAAPNGSASTHSDSCAVAKALNAQIQAANPSLPKTIASATHAPLKYAYRDADGSNYNPFFPTMGKAGSPYARSVASHLTLPKDSLPDPGLVFDSLLCRDESKKDKGYEEHPGGVSALFFAFADLVIHSIFDTNHFDWTLNDASSYLDLSVLYGSSEAQVASVRRFDGTGRLHNDVFADARLLHMPPASCALLVLLCRNHNYIAQKILAINERLTFNTDISSLSDKEKAAQDDEIFHRARLVNCGYFMHIILGDYVGAILGLVRDGSDWRLDPLMQIRNSNHDLEPVGEGNVVSVEFNLLYRWHATLSAQDTEWTEKMFDRLFEGQDPRNITINDFKRAAHKHLIPTKPVTEWTFEGLKRDASGSFSDDDLAELIHNSTEWRASAFKAHGIPACMRIIEIMGIQQARTWGTCSLNEFRKFIGLKPYDNFKEWNPDPSVYKTAQSLYKSIDNLELYVGLQAEQPKDAGPGAGLCPGYTISRAILADAVCLTRGDRFFTSDFTPANLTTWGYLDCQYDKEDGSYGGLLTKLLFRTLPNHFPRGSAYAHFPFLVPSFMKEVLKEREPASVEKYQWTRPKKAPRTVTVKGYEAAKLVEGDKEFISTADARIVTVAKPVVTKKLTKEGWRNNEKRLTQLKAVDKELVKAKDEIFALALSSPSTLSAFFESKTKDLIASKSFSGASKSAKYVNIVQDVINLIPIHWIAQEIAGLPVKTASNPSGSWSEQDTYTSFATVAEYVHLNLSPEHDWRLRETSQATATSFVNFVKEHVDHINAPLLSFKSKSGDTFNHMALADWKSHEFLGKVVEVLDKRGVSHREIAGGVFAAVVPTAAVWSAAVAKVVDFFLEEGQKGAREALVGLLNAKGKEKDGEKGKENEEKIYAYIREAVRLNPPLPGYLRTAGKEVVLGPETVQAFETVYTSLVSANLDPTVFGPDPAVPSFSASPSSGEKEPKALLLGNIGGLLTESFLLPTTAAVLKVVLNLKDLQRGPGVSGRITSFTELYLGSPRELYFNERGTGAFPDSLVVGYSA